MPVIAKCFPIFQDCGCWFPVVAEGKAAQRIIDHQLSTGFWEASESQASVGSLYGFLRRRRVDSSCK